jgi:hypothetical protein
MRLLLLALAFGLVLGVAIVPMAEATALGCPDDYPVGFMVDGLGECCQNPLEHNPFKCFV